MKKITSLLLVALLSFTLIFMVSCEDGTDPWDEALYTENQTLGQGKSTFTLEVAVNEHLVTFTVSTNEEMLDKALLEVGLIEGREDKYGLYMERVNGILADFNTDQTYWALYIDGKYALTGISSTPVENGATYKLSREK